MPQTRKTCGIWSLLIPIGQGISVYFEVMPWGTFLFARLFLPVLLDLFVYWLIDYTNNERILACIWLKIENCPPFSRHTRLPPPPPVSPLLPVLTLRVYSSYPSSVLSHTHTHTHTHTRALVFYPKRKPYSIHSLLLCLINSVSSWRSSAHLTPLSFFKDNLACWNHVNFPLPSGGNFLRKLWSMPGAAHFPSWPKEANAFKLPEAALPHPLARPVLVSVRNRQITLFLRAAALSAQTGAAPKARDRTVVIFLFFFFNKGMCLERGKSLTTVTNCSAQSYPAGKASAFFPLPAD